MYWNTADSSSDPGERWRSGRPLTRFHVPAATTDADAFVRACRDLRLPDPDSSDSSDSDPVVIEVIPSTAELDAHVESWPYGDKRIGSLFPVLVRRPVCPGQSLATHRDRWQRLWRNSPQPYRIVSCLDEGYQDNDCLFAAVDYEVEPSGVPEVLRRVFLSGIPIVLWDRSYGKNGGPNAVALYNGLPLHGLPDRIWRERRRNGNSDRFGLMWTDPFWHVDDGEDGNNPKLVWRDHD